MAFVNMKKTLTVAIAVQKFPNILQTYILNHMATLCALGVNILVIARKHGDTDKLPAAIREHRLLEKTHYTGAGFKSIAGEFLSLPLRNRSYRNAVGSIVKSGSWRQYGWPYFIKEFVRVKTHALCNFDILHSHTLSTTYIYLFLHDIFSTPIVTTFHGKEPRGSINLGADKANLVFQKGDIFLVNSEYSRKELLEMGCPSGKIHIIPQGTCLEDFPFQQRIIDTAKKIRLLTVGRLSVEKGHHIAIQAVARLQDRYPTLEYHIVGEGPARLQLQSLINDLGLNDRITLHGLKVGTELQSCYSQAHIFILPSIYTNDGYLVETQGVVLQEAQASGIPVIGSRTGGIPDVIEDGITGLLFDESSPGQLAEKICMLVDKPEVYQHLIRGGRKDVEARFDSVVVNSSMISLYEKILA
jgi:colanic acid/amylovoran biosynthesis glycosyltransferase